MTMANDQQIGLFAHPAFLERARLFEAQYQMIDYIENNDPQFSKKNLKGRKEKHCLFCNRDSKKTSFRNDAHLLPEMLGNRNLYSYFECDECNNKFSLFETDLAAYLGLGRSISGMKGEKKAPGFPGIDIEAKSIIFEGRKVMVIQKENAERNIDAGTTKLKYRKPTYKPFNVHKLFFKCALSILPNDDVLSNYQVALEYLRGGKVIAGSHISGYRFNLNWKMPLHVHVFKKINPSDKIPTHVVNFYFDHYVITLPILLYKEDMSFYDQSIDMPIAPPYFTWDNTIRQETPHTFMEDLSSPNKLKNKEEEIVMKFNRDDLDKATKLNIKNGEESQTSYNPSGSKYFILTEEGITFTKDQLKRLLELIEEKFG